MRSLDLPAPPLPADVRERVLQRVIAGTGLRPAHLVAAAAAVVVTLSVLTPVALTSDVAGINALARPAPASSYSAPTTGRCLPGDPLSRSRHRER